MVRNVPDPFNLNDSIDTTVDEDKIYKEAWELTNKNKGESTDGSDVKIGINPVSLLHTYICNNFGSEIASDKGRWQKEKKVIGCLQS